MRTLALLAAALLLTAPLQARTEPSEAPEEQLVLRLPGASLTFKVDGRQLSGPQTSLLWTEDAVRGFLYNRKVNLTLEEGRVTGLLDGGQLQLTLVPIPAGGVQVQGTVGNVLSSFRLTPGQLEGRIGRCSYDLRGEEDRPGYYSGSRTCPGEPFVPTNLELPSTLQVSSPAAQAALLALMLSL
jgi:hypothetical protein